MALLLPLILLLTLSLQAESAKPNILIITLDTTRADRLGCYGDKLAKTPTLDALAAGGALFTQAHAHVPLTLPSHAVLLSGQLPSTLKTPVNGIALSAGFPTLATHLAARGYATRAVVGAVILNREYGLARGFAAYDDRMPIAANGKRAEERTANDVTSAALEAMKGIKSPFFLWVHYYDPHYQYRPPAPHASRFRGDPYRGEIAYMDSAIAALLNALRRGGLLDNTLIAVAGDHGEGLSQHGEKQHGVFLYEDTLRVPLMLHWPGKIAPRQKIEALCGLADVASTILDLLGEGSLPRSDGLSLKPLLDGGTTAPRSVYIESYHGAFTYGWAPLRGLMTNQWKYIEAPRPELYDWRISEEKNLYADRRDDVRAAKKQLQRFAVDLSATLRPSREMNDETRQQLMSLGYLTSAGITQPGALDPKDVIGIEEELAGAKEALDAGDVRRGIRILERIVTRNPQNIPALSMLGIAYMNSGAYENARSCFERETHYRPEMAGSHLNLGTAYKRLGKPDLAIREYEKALSLSPRDADAAVNLARTHRERGASSDARRVLNAGFAAGAESADMHFELGLLDLKEANWEGARVAFAKAAALDPNRQDAQVNLGKLAWQSGRVDEAITAYRRASRIAPRNSTYLAALGSLYLNGKNDLQQALEFYRQAVSVDPSGPAAGDLRELIEKLETQIAN